MAHVRKSDNFSIFLSRVGDPRVFFYSLIFLSYHFIVFSPLFLVGLILLRFSLMNRVLNDALQSMLEVTFYRIYLEYRHGSITQLFTYLHYDVTIYFFVGLGHLHCPN